MGQIALSNLATNKRSMMTLPSKRAIWPRKRLSWGVLTQEARRQLPLQSVTTQVEMRAASLLLPTACARINPQVLWITRGQGCG